MSGIHSGTTSVERSSFNTVESRSTSDCQIFHFYHKVNFMGQERVGPRKPATKFPHLRKQLQKNAIPTKLPKVQFGQPQPKGGRP